MGPNETEISHGRVYHLLTACTASRITSKTSFGRANNDQNEYYCGYGHGFFYHRQKIAKATIARRTPSNGLETANQKEKFQPESWAIGVVFMILSKDFKDRHFTNA